MKIIWADKDGYNTLRRLERPHDPDTAVVSVVGPITQARERKSARIGQTNAWCMGADGEYRQSFALSAKSLIQDVHSPMDCYPVHARWDVVY